MKLLALVLTVATAAAVMAHSAGAVSIGFNACPNVGADVDGCQLLISVTAVDAAGVGTAYFVTQNPVDDGPFDGIEDTLVGIQNNSTANALKSIVLTGAAGSFLAGFDGDGACAGTGSTGAYNPSPTAAQCGGSFTFTDPQDYESAGVTFTLSANLDVITVNFNPGLAPSNGTTCGSAWFSLENALTPGSFNGGTPGTNCNSIGPIPTPEPGSAMLLSSGLVVLAWLARKRRIAR